jgi:hypothetical protein
MDPGLTLAALASLPIDGGTRVLTFPGAVLPVLIPVEILTPVQRVALARSGALAYDRAVTWLLEAGDTTGAWAALGDHPVAGAMEAPLARWAADELARLGLPAPRGGVVALATDRRDELADRASLALADVRDLLSELGWPLWAGPLVVADPEAEFPRLPPGDTRLARPALPALRLAAMGDGRRLRGLLAGRIAGLVLARCGPPDAGWPRWLTLGIATAATAKGDGLGLSPRAALRERRAAGLPALVDALHTADPDPALARSLAAALTAPWRRQALTSVLAALRQGATGEAALERAGIPLSFLLEHP